MAHPGQRAASLTDSTPAKQDHSQADSPLLFHQQVGSAGYRKEIEAISYAICPTSPHEGTVSGLDDPPAGERLCFEFDQDLRLADDVNLDDVTEWVRSALGCRLCIARVRNAARIHAAYKWYEVRQAAKDISPKKAPVSTARTREERSPDKATTCSGAWSDTRTVKLSKWMEESMQISEVMSS